MNIIFRTKTNNNNINTFNNYLYKASKGRFELRQTDKRKLYRVYDYDDNELVKDKKEIIDIIDNQFILDFVDKDNKDYVIVQNMLKELGCC